MTGVEGTRVQLHLQVGHLFQLNCCQETRAMRNIRYVQKNDVLITSAVLVRGDSICQQPPMGRREAGESGFISGFYQCVSFAG